MLRIELLYSEPRLFEPIEFSKGINLILGERNKTSVKTNGVGKSLSIEFINFCLLASFSDSRVSRIPESAFPYDALVCLDFVINNTKVTCKRSIEEHESPILVVDGVSTKYYNIKDATSYLTNLLFGSTNVKHHPSLRSLLAPLIRDERSEFKSIINCFDTNLKVPPDYTPHLYLLGIDPSSYNEAKKLQKEIDATTKAKTKLKNDVVTLSGKSFADAKADLNDLTSQVERIRGEMDRLENAGSYELVKDELIALETQLNDERVKESVIKSELSKLELFQGDNYIDDREVAELYNRFKQGLGDLIKKEIQEVTSFKKRIDEFQRTLIESRRETLLERLSQLRKRINSLDSSYKAKLQLIDQQGGLKSLKMTIATYQRKLEEVSQLSSFIKKYTDYESQIKRIKQDRREKIALLEALVSEARDIIKAVEEAILEIHEYVMSNRKCYFEVNIGNDSEIVEFDLRIHDDGSHSNEREKVFFYDMALLLTPHLKSTHPGLLIHDNIFDVDQDTLIKSLNYLAEHTEALSTKQYILTLNSDKLHDDELKGLKLNFAKYRRAAFTKDQRFLGGHYQEK